MMGHLYIATRALSLLSLLLLIGCATDPGTVREKLDPVTSVTISYSNAPLVFCHEAPGRAAYARDYVHLAPMEVNRSGRYEYYLWLGIWNTMQDAGMTRDGFESVIIYADGEPLLLEVSGWNAAAVGASESVFLKPVASAADAYYAVTVDQLRLIAAASDVRLQSTGARGRSYEPWDDQRPAMAGLLEFLGSSVY